MSKMTDLSKSNVLSAAEFGYNTYKYCKGDMDKKEYVKETSSSVASAASATAVVSLGSTIGAPAVATTGAVLVVAYGVKKAVDFLWDFF